MFVFGVVICQVFFDIDAGGKDMGRITLELRADVVPKTAGMIRLAAHTTARGR